MTWTKEHRKLYDRKRNIEQRPWKTSRAAARRNEIRAWLDDLKKTMKCANCSENHPACLQFHHIGQKDFSIGDMASGGFSKDRILKEIQKCIVLCANCHFKEHDKS